MGVKHLLIAGCEIPGWHGDNICDDENNNEACFFDGGDCCGSNVNTGYCMECLCLEGGGCLIVRINLTNELLNGGYEYINGDYEISIMPNGQTSWINGDYAIWYYPGYWYLVDIGSNVVIMYAINDFHGLTDDENEWNYWTGSSWTSPIDPNDIQITCVNE